MIRRETVLDVGCGLHPQREFPSAVTVGLDAHRPYLDELRSKGHRGLLLHGSWKLLVNMVSDSFDAVVALDFIEHLTSLEGQWFLSEAKRVAPRVVIFTPNGWLPQTKDAFGMGGEHWQTHRSGWVPTDFEGWEIQMHRETQLNGIGAFWARWER